MIFKIWADTLPPSTPLFWKMMFCIFFLLCPNLVKFAEKIFLMNLSFVVYATRLASRYPHSENEVAHG